MNRSPSSLCFALAAGLALGLFQGTAARADTTMGTAPLDCSKADFMTKMKSDSHVDASTGNADKDYAAMVVSLHERTVAVAKLEAACGRDAKAKEAARKLAERGNVDDALFETRRLMHYGE